MGQVVDDVQTLVAPILEQAGVELVDVTYQKGPGGWALCFYLDKPGGITLSDCEEWSRKIGEILDEKDLIPNAYNLEVSSPGLNRPLKRTADFQRFIGQRVSVRLFAPLDGRKNFQGPLRSATDDEVRVLLEDEKREAMIPRSMIAKTTLDPILEI